jgi:hypothetical protein
MQLTGWVPVPDDGQLRVKETDLLNDVAEAAMKHDWVER